MWIDRLEFIGFGNLTGQGIDLARNKVSIVVQPNEYGKSTMCEAIWSILFDYPNWEPNRSASKPGIERKPHSGAAFKACLDVRWQERNIRLIRSFADRSLKILDLSKDPAKANSDITSQYSGATGTEMFGEELTGLTRDLFRKVFVVSQRQLQLEPFAGDRALSTYLFNVADSAGASTNAFEAVTALELALDNLPFREKFYTAKDLIDTLEGQQRELLETLHRLEGERQNCDRDVESLSELDERLHSRGLSLAVDEYFQLCLESADIESRLTRAQDKLVRVDEVRRQCQSLSSFENFPILRLPDVQELWAKRQARVSDLRRLENELKTKSVAAQIRDLEYRERGDGLEHFSVEDAHTLAELARTLQTVMNDVEDTRKRRLDESQRVRGVGVDLDSLASVRYALLTLEPKDLDEAYACHAMFIAARDKAAECERSADTARTIIKEINETRYDIRSNLSRAFWVCIGVDVLFLCLLGVFVRILDDSGPLPLLLSMGITCFGVVAFIVFFIGKILKWRTQDENKARGAELKHQAVANEMWSRAATLETRIEDLARKAGLLTAQQLIQNMQEYTVSAAQLKDLDMLEHMLGNRELHAAKLRSQLSKYFERAQRMPAQITPKEALGLAESITRYLEDERRAHSSSELLDHRESEMRFLGDEVKDIDSLLQNHFSQAGLNFVSIEDGQTKFNDAVNCYRTWEYYRTELNRLESDTTTDLPLADLTVLIERLEHKRVDIWNRMQYLVSQNPQIANVAPPTAESCTVSARELSETKAALEQLKLERDELMVQMRAAMRNYQDNYLRTLEDLERVEKELEHVRRATTSLTLARDMFLRLADENHSIWADKLNDISRDMLRQMGADFENFEFNADLSFTVRRKGQREPINDWQLANQLSNGTREQLHWLARLAVAQFLSKDRTLPILLDEPFSECDDERFLKMMRFLINVVSKTNQVVIFSCHQQRHEWLLDHLDPNEQQLVELCRLSPLHSDSNAYVRR